jgi:hypothetical protein
MAVRGNKPKPVADKLIRGNPGNRPLTTMVPAPRSGAMMCPLQVAKNAIAKTYWDMYLENAAPGHLAPLDAPLLARLCMCLARIDEAETAMGSNMLVKMPNSPTPQQSPLLGIINRQTEIARKLASELALPPAQRNRLGIHEGGAAADDPAEQYFTN